MRFTVERAHRTIGTCANRPSGAFPISKRFRTLPRSFFYGPVKAIRISLAPSACDGGCGVCCRIRDRVSSVLNLRGVAERIEYWLTGSQLESSLLYLELAADPFPRGLAAHGTPASAGVCTSDHRQSVPADSGHHAIRARFVLRTLREPRRSGTIRGRRAGSVSDPAVRRESRAVADTSRMHLWRDE